MGDCDPLADAGANVAVNYKENESAASELVSALVSAVSRCEQVADVAVMLARNRYFTGQSVNIDGGLDPTA